jgi:hypothetical protein
MQSYVHFAILWCLNSHAVGSVLNSFQDVGHGQVTWYS